MQQVRSFSKRWKRLSFRRMRNTKGKSLPGGHTWRSVAKAIEILSFDGIRDLLFMSSNSVDVADTRAANRLWRRLLCRFKRTVRFPSFMLQFFFAVPTVLECVCVCPLKGSMSLHSYRECSCWKESAMFGGISQSIAKCVSVYRIAHAVFTWTCGHYFYVSPGSGGHFFRRLRRCLRSTGKLSFSEVFLYPTQCVVRQWIHIHASVH